MDWDQLQKEVSVRYSRSSGAGGQHVNKVATRVELTIYPKTSEAFSESEKSNLLRNLADNISKEGALAVSAQDSRSQLRNRRIAWEKLKNLVSKAIRPPKPKRKAKAFRADRQKRLEAKSRRAEVKRLRGKVVF